MAQDKIILWICLILHIVTAYCNFLFCGAIDSECMLTIVPSIASRTSLQNIQKREQKSLSHTGVIPSSRMEFLSPILGGLAGCSMTILTLQNTGSYLADCVCSL